MPDNGTQSALTLVRLPEGGYLVQDAFMGDHGRLHMQLYASTTIDDALSYMRAQILPIPPTAAPVTNGDRESPTQQEN